MSVRHRMRNDLKIFMKRRDRVAVSALRTALSAIDNAEAVAVDSTPSGEALVGLGAAETARSVLTESDMVAIVSDQIEEIRTTVDEDGEHFDEARLADLRKQVDTLENYLVPPRM